MPTFADFEKFDETITPKEVMEVIHETEEYENVVLREIFEMSLRESEGLGEVQIRGEIDLGDVDEGPKWELSWLVQSIKLAFLSELVSEKVILYCNLQIKEYGKEEGKTERKVAVIGFYPNKFLVWYEKRLGFKVNGVPTFDDKTGIITFGNKKCEVGVGTNTFYFCEVMFRMGPDKKVKENSISDEIDSERKGITPSFKRAARDAMYAVNQKVESEIGIEKLFEYKRGQYWFNEKYFKDMNGR